MTIGRFEDYEVDPVAANVEEQVHDLVAADIEEDLADRVHIGEIIGKQDDLAGVKVVEHTILPELVANVEEQVLDILDDIEDLADRVNIGEIIGKQDALAGG